MTSPEPFEGKRALVSGASRGIGRAIALALAEAGADVAGLARSSDALAALGAQIEERGRSFLAGRSRSRRRGVPAAGSGARLGVAGRDRRSRQRRRDHHPYCAARRDTRGMGRGVRHQCQRHVFSHAGNREEDARRRRGLDRDRHLTRRRGRYSGGDQLPGDQGVADPVDPRTCRPLGPDACA